MVPVIVILVLFVVVGVSFRTGWSFCELSADNPLKDDVADATRPELERWA